MKAEMLVESVSVEKAMWRCWTFTDVDKETFPRGRTALFTQAERETYRFWISTFFFF